MTITQALEIVDRLTPNQYDMEDKIRWLSELDGIAHREVLRTHEMDVPEEFHPYRPEQDLDRTVLLIGAPYDEIYRWYLDMKIAEANGETDRYNAAAGSYNQYFTAWQNYINRSYMPRERATHFRL